MHKWMIVVALFLVPLAGCRTEPTPASTENFSSRNTYNVAAKTVADRVKAATGLPIESENAGRLVTGWEPHKGAMFGVGSVGRQWQERTRYTITISPAWDDPTGKTTIDVAEETQQRPHDKYEWDTQEPVKRPERAAEMARKIDTALSRASS